MHRNTEKAVVEVTNDLIIASDEGLVSVLILEDRSAGFDTTEHHILLQKR